MKTDNKQPATPENHSERLILECDYRDHGFEHWPRPSEMDLARLAAQLARSTKIAPKQLVDEAWELYWESCRRLQADSREVAAYHAHTERVDEDLDWAEEVGSLPKWVPAPKSYPVLHQQVERLLLPKQKGRTAERASLIREFFFAQLTRGCLVLRPKITLVTYWELDSAVLEDLRQKLKDDVARHFEKYRKTVFDADAYARFAVPFLQWRHRYLVAQKAAAARKRWEKIGIKQNQSGAERGGQEVSIPKNF